MIEVKRGECGQGRPIETIQLRRCNRLASTTDALGRTTTYSYDPDDLLTGISYANAVNPTANVLYRYSPYCPHLLSMTDGPDTTTFSYVSLGSADALELQSVARRFGVNDTINYAYSADGRLGSWVTRS